jgi:RimJ/RimL family protein N-acetyltransferase
MEQKEERKHYYFFEGKKINLRGIEKEDYTERMYKWANDPEFNRYLSHGLKPATIATMEKLYEDLINKENVIFAIVDKKTKITVGVIGLHHFNWQIISAEFTIHIGEKEFWGSGAASEATDFIVKYAFETLNLNKIWLGVNEANVRAVKFYEKKGFVNEGKLRAEIFRENKYFNSIIMSILRKEYESRKHQNHG